MKLRAHVVPYSTVVGGGITLQDTSTGRVVGQLSLMNIEAGREAYLAMAKRVADAINAGQGERQVKHTKSGGVYDLVPIASFQVSEGQCVAGKKGRLVSDQDPVVVYRNPQGKHFVRFPDEMTAPRFEEV